VLQRVPAFKVTAPDAPLLPDLDIDVDRLQIDRLVAEAAVSGERRELRLTGKAKIADRRAQITAQVVTLAAPGGRGGDRLDLTLDAVPEANRLALKLAIDAPRGGVIAALARLPEPLSLKLDGAGDWSRWDGQITADLGGKRMTQLRLAARNGTFSAKGPAELGRLFGGIPAVLMDQTTQLDLVARLDQRRAALSGSVRSDVIAITPTGVVDLGLSAFDKLKFELLMLRPAKLGPNLSGRAVRADLQLNGAFARPEVQYCLTAGALAVGNVVLEGLDASGRAQVQSDQVMVPVSARIVGILGMDGVAGGTLANVRIDGDLALDGTRLLSDNLKLRSDRIDATAILLADTGRGLYTGAFQGRINNYTVDSVGTFAVDTSADLKRTGGGFALTGMVRVRSTNLVNAAVRDFLGGQAAGSSQIAYGPDGVLHFSGLRVAAPQLQVFDGRGSYVPGGALKLTANGRSARYGPLALELTGTLLKPRAVLLAGSPGMGIGLANVRAEIVGDEGDFRFNATGQTDLGPFSADVSLIRGVRTAFQINRGDLSGIGFTGRIDKTEAGPYTGVLRAEGQGFNGTVQLRGVGRYQEAVIQARASDTVLPGPARLAIGRGIIDARIVLYDRPEVTADVQLAQMRLRYLDLAAARAQIAYRGGRGQVKFLAEGVSGAPFRLAGNALLEPDLWRASLQGRVRGVAFNTASPARIVPRQSGYELLPTRVEFGHGSVRLAGRYGPGLRIESRMDRLDIALLNAFFPGYGIGGRATGSLDFEQSTPDTFPTAEARLTVNGFSRSTAAAVSQPVDVNLAGDLAANRADLRAVIRERGAVIGRLNARLTPSGGGDWTDRLAAGTLGGGIRYNGPADTLWSFVGQGDQSLSGPIAVGADFSGRLRAPQLSGIVRGDSLTYDNQTFGTRLTQLAVAGRLTGERVEFSKLTANAGSGKIAGQGYLSLSAESDYPMDLSFDLDNARLARSDALSSAATGELRLRKLPGETALLSGRLLLPETRYELVRQGASEVPELTGVRFKPPRGIPRVTGNEPAPPAGSLFRSLRLDVQLSAPNQLFVTGMGLDSEWSADLRVGGTSAAPLVAGDINLVRGNLGFAGRQFELQDGRLLFTGGALSNPQIVLSASEEIDDIGVAINISGRALNPQISFSSTPALPSDEILSRILFGNSVGQLSPLQAVQLAASLNSLRASGGGFNPLGKLRAATGVSRLRILAPDEAIGRGTAVAAGRYISNNIYLEVISDARGYTATQIEVGLSRTLSVLSQAGGGGGTNINLRYKKRY
jgi:translocation and assembly module TamB